MLLVWAQEKLSIKLITYNGNFKKYEKSQDFLTFIFNSQLRRWERKGKLGISFPHDLNTQKLDI